MIYVKGILLIIYDVSKKSLTYIRHENQKMKIMLDQMFQQHNGSNKWKDQLWKKLTEDLQHLAFKKC